MRIKFKGKDIVFVSRDQNGETWKEIFVDKEIEIPDEEYKKIITDIADAVIDRAARRFFNG